MIELKRIFPECNADTFLVQLILQRGFPAHYGGITKVAAAIEKIQNDTLFVVGVVDNDKFKNVPQYLKDFQIIPETEDDTNLTILRKPNTQKHVIKVNPAFEKWIWNVAQICEVDPSIYGFLKWEDLANYKGNDVYNNVNFKRFINAIITENPPAIEKLRFWLSKANSDN